MKIQMLKLSDILPDKDQPRKNFDEESLERLTVSIKENGIESPLVVRKDGDEFILIDGERRWRASQRAGLTEVPCIVSDNPAILEQQLRTDCLKEGLGVDELDEAIYRYYQMLPTTREHPKTVNKGYNPYTQMIADSIGKSADRIRIAIDRFEFKQENPEFIEAIKEKYIEEGTEGKYKNKVNSTIALTSKLKDNPDVRKAVVEGILEDRYKTKIKAEAGVEEELEELENKTTDLDNPTIKKRVSAIAEQMQKKPDLSPKEAKTALHTITAQEEKEAQKRREAERDAENKKFNEEQKEKQYDKSMSSDKTKKLVKEYYEGISSFMDELEVAIEGAKRGKFAPENKNFMIKKHSLLIEKMKELEALI